jgi:hypothetical protein
MIPARVNCCKNLGSEGLWRIGPFGDRVQAQSFSHSTGHGDHRCGTEGVLAGLGEHGWGKNRHFGTIKDENIRKW